MIPDHCLILSLFSYNNNSITTYHAGYGICDLRAWVWFAVVGQTFQRTAFRPTMMEPADPARSGQVTQRYFWGVHEGVGGGHMRRQQSAFCALRGLVEEIRKRSIPLSIDDDLLPSYDVTAKVELTFSDRATDGFFNLINVFTGEYIRHVDGIQQVHHTALTRYVKVLDWRPLALRSLQNEIMQNREQYE